MAKHPQYEWYFGYTLFEDSCFQKPFPGMDVGTAAFKQGVHGPSRKSAGWGARSFMVSTAAGSSPSSGVKHSETRDADQLGVARLAESYG